MKRLKNMRTSTKYIFLAVILLSVGLGSCQDELDLAPETQISDANFWNSPSDLEKAANYFYSLLPDINDMNDNQGTFSYSNDGADEISDGTRLAGATSGDWNNAYKLIRASNNLLEKSENVIGDEASINKYLAEARFFRAWAYAGLVRRFGDVPLITKTLSETSEELYGARTDRQTVIELVYEDLDFAAANLPMSSAQPAAEYGRITATAVLAFKSRVALFEGTRAKFHNYGNPNEHLQLAVDAADKVITSGEHQLFIYNEDPAISFRKLFQDAGDGKSNKEAILVRLYAENASNNLSSHRISENRINQGKMVPTRTLADLYLYQDGLPIGKSPLAKPQTNSLSQFEKRDPRMEMTIFNSNLYYSPTALYVPSFSFTPTGYKFSKYYDPLYLSPPDSWVDFQIIRYAEVLLNYAEAKFELNGAIDNADLDKSINLIRARVNMPPLTNAFVAANGLDMRIEIRRERAIELAMEEFNYWDLIRWKTAEVELPKTVYGAKYFEAEYGPATNKLDGENFVIVQAEADRFFDPARDYLWPIPLQEIGLNSALTQNPNW